MPSVVLQQPGLAAAPSRPDPQGSPVRLAPIDLIKFLGMLFVVLCHAATVDYDIVPTVEGCMVLLPSPLAFGHYILRALFSAGVPLFFFANGYLLIQKPFSLKKHLLKIFRLILLTEVWGMLTLLLLRPIKGEWLSPKDLVYALYTLQDGWLNPLWYMGALVCIYFFFPLIKAAFDHQRTIFHYWTALCVFFGFGSVFLQMLATLLCHLVLGSGSAFPYSFFHIFDPFSGLYGHAFAYFSLGCLAGGDSQLAQRLSRRIGRPWLYLAALVSTLLLGGWGIFNSMLSGRLWNPVWGGYDTVFALVLTLALCLLCQTYQDRGRPLHRYIRVVSQNTLGIYFIHEIWVQLFNAFGIRSLPFAGNYLFDLVYTLFIITLCLLTVFLLRRIPLLRRLV